MTNKQLRKFFKEYPAAEMFEHYPKLAKYLYKLWLYEKTIKKDL